MNNFLLEGERLDDLHRNNYKLIQNPKYFCFGMDAVLLSGFADVGKDKTALDLGTGTGIIPVLLSAKTKGQLFYGLEVQKEMAEMAARSVQYNNLQDRIKIVHGDIKKMIDIFKPSSVDCITVNPPYMNETGGLKNDFSPKAIARHEILCTLEDIIYGSSKVVKPGGSLYMVHRPHRLTDIICLMRKYQMEPKVIRFVQPYIDKEPNMVLIEAVRQGKPMVKVMDTLVIYNRDGSYTPELNKIYYE